MERLQVSEGTVRSFTYHDADNNIVGILDKVRDTIVAGQIEDRVVDITTRFFEEGPVGDLQPVVQITVYYREVP